MIILTLCMAEIWLNSFAASGAVAILDYRHCKIISVRCKTRLCLGEVVKYIPIAMLLTGLLLTQATQATEIALLTAQKQLFSNPANLSSTNTSWQMAQYDSYDPFVDFSEFDESTEEEADINFFRNGRFFTLGFLGGYRGFTQGMANIQKADIHYGLNLTYFFDLRFALQLAYTTGDHSLQFVSPNGTAVNGTARLSTLSMHLKYYFNTQNVTKGLAELNPYIIGGFSRITRESKVADQEAFAKEGASSFDLGAGIEIPMMRNKMYVGVQGVLQLANFSDETTEIVVQPGNEKTGLFNNGDIYLLQGVIGINF